MSLNTTPRTWVTSEVVTAAEMNTEVRDAVTGIQAAWTTYVPAWTSSGTAPVLGNGTLTGRYMQIGKTVSVEVILTMGSTTTFGTGNYFLSLPSLGNSAAFGYNLLARVADASPVATYYGGMHVAASSTTFGGHFAPGTAGAGWVQWNPTNPITWASGDILIVSGTYELA